MNEPVAIMSMLIWIWGGAVSIFCLPRAAAVNVFEVGA